MSNTGHVLNLDELFGVDQPVVVEWKGKRFELTRPEGMTPVQHRDFAKLEQRIRENKLDEDADPVELEYLMIELIRILNPDLVKHQLPYGAMIKILEFYQAQVLPESSNAKKAGSPSTGA